MTENELILQMLKNLRDDNKEEHREIKRNLRETNEKLDSTSVISTKKVTAYAAIITGVVTIISQIIDTIVK